MATYSTSLQIKLITDGTESGTWGSSTNTNWNLMEQAVAGVQNITMVNADYTLSVVNGGSDEARNAVLVVAGTNSAIRKIVAPLVPKVYVVFNNTSGGFAITIGGSTGSVATIPTATTCLVYCDGTNFYAGSTGSAGNFTVSGNEIVSGNLSVSGNATVTGTTTFVGIPSGPTANAGTSTTQLATTSFVTSAVSTATGSLGTMSTQNANNVSITGGTITGITDLAVADGGTGSSSLTANNVILGNGTSAVQVVAPSTSGNVLTSNGTTWQSTANPKLGSGQTWQDLTSSRASGTTYTNSTSAPIYVSIIWNCTNNSGATLYVDSIPVSQVQIAIYTAQVTTCAIVPPGSTYSTIVSGGFTVSTWAELR